MQKVLDFLKANPVFQLATVEGDQPRNRPFGFTMVEEGRLYFITGEQKKVCAQLKANPRFEISVSNAQGEWMRLAGRAVFDTRPELVEKAFGIMPMLRNIYGVPGGMTAALFYADQATAVFADMSGKSETVTL